LPILSLEPTFEIRTRPGSAHRPMQTAACRAAHDAVSCEQLLALSAPALLRSCSPLATVSAELPAPTRVSVCAAPSACALAATPAPPLRFPATSDWGDAPVPDLGLAAPPALLAGTAAANSIRSPARCRRSHTARSSCAIHVPAPKQTAFSRPSHCSLSRASCSSTCPVNLQRQESPRSILSDMSPVCTRISAQGNALGSHASFYRAP